MITHSNTQQQSRLKTETKKKKTQDSLNGILVHFFLILTHIQQSALGLEHNDLNQKENIQFCV